MTKLPTVLEGIVQGRFRHLDEIKARLTGVDLATLPRSERSLYNSLARGGTQFIMECKSSSPSLGTIREHYEPGELASIYSRYAAGISVLCEPDKFGGDYDHLATVASLTHLPVLCKDFIVDEIQVYAARYFGADAILLMLSVLDDASYTRLSTLAEHLGLDVLTEVIDEEEAGRAARLGARIFGVNHRNLHDLSIDLERSARLAPLAPEGALIVSESGVRDVATVRRLGSHSDGFLVGSHLTGQPDVDLAARMLVYGPNKVCGLTSLSAVQAARAAGAVYGGLIYESPSPRNVSRETSAEIISHEPHLKYVAVSRRTNGWAELLQDGVHAVQVHAPFQGSIDAEIDLMDSVRSQVGDGVEVWRAVSMTRPEGAQLSTALLGSADKLVLDAQDGGSGAPFDWNEVPEDVKDHALLAGGIGPQNVADALRVGCLGVDLNSGVEYPADAGEWAGRKDSAALRRTFTTIRNFHF
ncbi:bifunctional indole-3-glycerol-phosphate synthase TrpC/phosphoribosylanthranilate isomerase TrpF [Corynebacterium qintianiae]|uniref:N-(5'-phosphoribosyl)anthranilate isomerase n=1 Tax=Corynebacterium qintianiae TaxID=2709392 RepID=A0A7T0KMI8_9CORY|nr:bifunctional indole-3-glycerol-phosphate synthase TrpC/phosphoribosylanthranilate isomerase TrpF [Corynebacterium qintianiae]QPK83242.1 bifunctional indole-3-glycerol-phosphate synthase TrpC/phosphoribosylanthranilate isomerase TrpF [Corynebacterium qintianiae]